MWPKTISNTRSRIFSGLSNSSINALHLTANWVMFFRSRGYADALASYERYVELAGDDADESVSQ
jgi:hypothetical protein